MLAYLPILMTITLALALGFVLVALSRLMGPFRPKAEKLTTYESGMNPVGAANERFSVKFYLVAMLFILFDIEVVFMYPWAVNYRSLLQAYGPFPLIEMLAFIGILFVGYVYALKKGGFDWK